MKRLKADAPIAGLGPLTLGDFWSWAYSDLLSNVNRSTFAEFLVAAALGLHEEPRVPWDAVDLRYQGQGIEVKAAAYLQGWQQARLSTIRFDIAEKKGGGAATNTYPPEPTRSADCYVFCLYPETDPGQADILDVGAWETRRAQGCPQSGLCEPVGYGRHDGDNPIYIRMTQEDGPWPGRIRCTFSGQDHFPTSGTMGKVTGR